jgi:hypothetical protein
MMSDPFDQFAHIVDNRMQNHVRRSLDWVPAILGTITETGLRLDHFKHEIKDYLVADFSFDGEIEGNWQVPAHNETGQITLPAIPGTNSSTIPGNYQATYQFDEWKAENQITVSKFKMHLKPNLNAGDRVLVMPVNQGQIFVVLAKVI